MIFGLKEANYVEAKIKQLGIQDVQLLFDTQIGMWSVCQVQRHVTSLMLPQHYQQENVRPYIMWWVKDNNGRPRLPNDNDVNDIIVTTHRAHKIWEKKTDYLADKLDEQSAEKDRKHRQKQHEMIKSIAPDMKKAIRNGNL
jgi:hypothetical protein